MQQILEKIANLEARKKQIHKDSNRLVFGRKDILMELDKYDMKYFKTLNDEYAALVSELKSLVKQVVLMSEIPKLTSQEDRILNTLYDAYPNALTSKNICGLSNLKRARVHEHLRTFIVARLVDTGIKSDKRVEYYVLTDRGYLSLKTKKKLGESEEPPSFEQ
jgi:DNA-binding MarR family transcriptional regulator